MAPSQTDAGHQIALRPPPALDGEIIAPGDCGVDCFARQHVFKTEFKHLKFAAGLTLQEILAQAVPDRRMWPYAHIVLGADVAVPRDGWQHMRPKPGTRVTINLVPQGGGGGSTDILRIVLMVSILAFAVAAPFLFPAAAFAIGGVSVSIGTLVGAGVSLAGTPCRYMLISVAPPP